VNASGKIITFVNLPIVVTVFILVAKAKVNSTTFQDATASFSIELLTGFVNQVILLPVMYVFMTFVAAVTPLQLGDRIDNVFGSWTIPVSLTTCLVLADFLQYWAHRSAHRVEVLPGSPSP
jgi:sterol desaturase/sphingolipid hydroxylase (fatty acid hydroxylase superfamily)